METQNRLIISEKIFTNPDPYITLAYLTIQKVTKHNLYQDFVFNPNIICYHIYGNMTQNLDKIVAACKVLASQKLIGKAGGDYYVTNFNSFYNIQAPFTFIYEDELADIVNSGKHNMPGMLQYFVSMMATVNSISGWGYTTGKTFAERLGVSTNTIYAYDKFLKKNKLVTFMRRERKNYLYKRKRKYAIDEGKDGDVGSDNGYEPAGHASEDVDDDDLF